MASARIVSSGRIIRRRQLFGAAAGALATLNIGLAQRRNVLTFIPQSDLAIFDLIFTAAYVTRHHGMMVFDTLYGMDEAYQIQPQMADGHRIEDDGKTWLITLRGGLVWHDGEKVLAQDCAASIRCSTASSGTSFLWASSCRAQCINRR